MQIVPISKFKATCLALLEKVRETGEPILVTRRGEPVAEVIPPPAGAADAGWLGAMAGRGRIVGDIVSPPLDEQEWETLGP
jgi:prevent-host-death family protein